MEDYVDKYVKNLNYYGALKNQNIDVLNEELVLFLLKENIIRVYRDFSNEPYKSWMDDVENAKALTKNFYFNKVGYCINEKVLNEIYSIIKLIVETECDVSYEIDELNFVLVKYFDSENKIKYLKEKYSEYSPNDLSYGIFLEKENFKDDYQSWKDIVINEFSNDIVCWYLTEDTNKLDSDEDTFWWQIISRRIGETEPELYMTINMWFEFYESKLITEYILSKIKELEKELNTTTKSHNNTTNNYTAKEIGYFAYYMWVANHKITEAPFPSETAYKELAERFSRHWKNIQMEFSLLRKREERTKQGRHKQIEKIMDMLSPEAKSLAESDLLNT